MNTDQNIQDRPEKVRAAFNRRREDYLGRTHKITFRQQVVREYIDSGKGYKILDVGCGDGSLSLQFQSSANLITLVDISEEMLKTASSRVLNQYRSKVELKNGNLLEFETETKYDFILCIGVLAHVPSIDGTIKKVSELLRDGGKCIIEFTDSSSVFGKINLLFHNKVLKRTFDYELNEITQRRILDITSKYELVPVDEKQFITPLPGMGKFLNNRSIYNFIVKSQKFPFISKIASGRIILFEKSSS